ncbi:MAG: tRNA glutamyl-Q(34) synthetase GluQRS [Casimicrobiaceae bacterium]
MRGRYAPAPTGPLHFGSLVAAVASHADARARGGGWRLRIDDVDATRARDAAAGAIIASLARHGFVWDGEVVRQSERIARYDAAFATLCAHDAVFACTCSRAELAHSPLGIAGERVYPGTCRHADPRARAGVAGVAWRMRVDGAVVEFSDRVQGPQRQSLADDVGDFVVRRSDGLHAYQLAIVVDDGDDAITDVVRGADLLASTPRQILLQRALGLPTPAYLHVPVAVDARGDKLSKQTHAHPLDADPVVALLAAWQFLGQPPAEAVPRSPAQFWQHACNAWTPLRIPALAALPCPASFA